MVRKVPVALDPLKLIVQGDGVYATLAGFASTLRLPTFVRRLIGYIPVILVSTFPEARQLAVVSSQCHDEPPT